MNNYGLLIRNKHPARLCRTHQARPDRAPDLHLKVEMSDDVPAMVCPCPELSVAPENFNLPIIGPNFDYLIRENARSLSRNLESKLNCDNFQTVKLSSLSAIHNKREREREGEREREKEVVRECFLGTVNMSCYIFY